MREQEFLDKLGRALQALPAAQRLDILTEYRSHFFEARERGKSDEDIAKSLGDPRTIGQTYAADYHFVQWRNPEGDQSVGKSLSHLLRGSLVLVSLLFFNFFFMLWPFLIISILLAAAWVGVLAALIGGMSFGLASIFGQGVMLTTIAAKFAMFFYVLGGVLLGALLLLGLFAVSRLLVVGVLRYIKLNLKLIAP